MVVMSSQNAVYEKGLKWATIYIFNRIRKCNFSMKLDLVVIRV